MAGQQNRLYTFQQQSSKPRSGKIYNMNFSSRTGSRGSIPRAIDMEWNLSDQSTNSAGSGTTYHSVSTPGTEIMYSFESTSPLSHFASGSFGNELPRPLASPEQYLGLTSSVYDSAPYQDRGGTTRSSPSTLGWTPDTELPKIYIFVVKKGREPYLDLMPGYQVTYQTPQRVYLDTEVSPQKGKFTCMFPGICKNKAGERSHFGRPADLDRHYKHIHSSIDALETFPCDYQNCLRASDPFTRKDHYRDHLRDFHKEDLGRVRGEKTAKDAKARNKWNAEQEKWLEERIVKSTWWRCPKCLVRVYIKKQGWACGDCKSICDDERIAKRQQLGAPRAAGSVDEKYRQSSSRFGRAAVAVTQYDVPVVLSGSGCQNCSGTYWVDNLQGSWVECPACSPSSTTYSVDGDWSSNDYNMTY